MKAITPPPLPDSGGTGVNVLVGSRVGVDVLAGSGVDVGGIAVFDGFRVSVPLPVSSGDGVPELSSGCEDGVQPMSMSAVRIPTRHKDFHLIITTFLSPSIFQYQSLNDGRVGIIQISNRYRSEYIIGRDNFQVTITYNLPENSWRLGIAALRRADF